jgi:predicted RNase H-like HicB family nuclease
MEMTRVYFPAIVEGGRRPGYSVFFPDLPGLASAGDSVQAAALNAEEALRGHIALLAEEGHEIPGARALDARGRAHSGRRRCSVDARAPDQCLATGGLGAAHRRRRRQPIAVSGAGGCEGIAVRRGNAFPA